MSSWFERGGGTDLSFGKQCLFLFLFCNRRWNIRLQAGEKEKKCLAAVSVRTVKCVNLHLCELLLLACWPCKLLHVMFTTLPMLFPVPSCNYSQHVSIFIYLFIYFIKQAFAGHITSNATISHVDFILTKHLTTATSSHFNDNTAHHHITALCSKEFQSLLNESRQQCSFTTMSPLISFTAGPARDVSNCHSIDKMQNYRKVSGNKFNLCIVELSLCMKRDAALAHLELMQH